MFDTLIKIQSYLESWKEYFDELGEEIEVIANEIKGPSWNP